MANSKTKSKSKTKKSKKTVAKGIVHISSTFNNTIVTVTDENGGALTTASAGSAGFNGSKKSTPFAAQLASEIACKKAFEQYSMQEVQVWVSGPGAGRETATRAVANSPLKITLIKDVTPLPHNGCRAPGARRV